MADAGEYSIEFVGPAIVRSDPHVCYVVYKDALGSIYLSGVETAHECGGVLVFPSEEEWRVEYPRREGQRGKIRERVREFLQNNEQYTWIPQSLSDESLTPEQQVYIKARYARVAAARSVREGGLRIGGLLSYFPPARDWRLLGQLILGAIALAALSLLIMAVVY